MTKTIKNRAQFQMPVSGKWAKINLLTGRIIQIKQTSGPFSKILKMNIEDI